MPMYEYECKNCTFKFERIQKFSDPALTICPKCDCPGLEKLISSSFFSLKGSGWHNTDYKAKNSCSSAPDKTSNKPAPCSAAKTCPAASSGCSKEA